MLRSLSVMLILAGPTLAAAQTAPAPATSPTATPRPAAMQADAAKPQSEVAPEALKRQKNLEAAWDRRIRSSLNGICRGC